jgi:periplasmic copper chaperone A
MRPPANLRLALVAVATILVACTGSASPSVSVADAWARPAASGADTAAYLTITNPGTAEDALLSVSSPDASMAGLHKTSTDASGMTGMAPVQEIAVPAGGTVTLAPGGFHVMLMGLGRDLTAGGTLELHLVFRNAGALTVQAAVHAG